MKSDHENILVIGPGEEDEDLDGEGYDDYREWSDDEDYDANDRVSIVDSGF